MKIRLADNLLKKLSELGQTIDIDGQTQVFDGGEVGIVENLQEKEIHHERQGTRGSSAGSRQGSEGPWRAPGEAGDPVGRIWPQWLIDDGLTLLLDSYPSSRVFLSSGGCWIKLTLSPLGSSGPRAILLIAVPTSKAIHPRCWCFWCTPLGVQWVGPRHTNYPFGDACAFPQWEGYWDRSEGVCAYADIHAEWLIRQLFLSAFERWPGRQKSPFALYALSQIKHNEHCHCQSGRQYQLCCHKKDRAEFRADPVGQMRTALNFAGGRWFNNQSPPLEVTALALGQTPLDVGKVMSWFNECVDMGARLALFRGRLLGNASTTLVKLRSKTLPLTA